MSDEVERVGYLREKLGHEARKKGENPHESASGEFLRGHRKLSVGFGGNTNTKSFGRGAGRAQDWTCVCGSVQKGHIKFKVANREICPSCRQEREFVDKEWLGIDDDTA
jgi:hypothetical protein